MLGLRFGLFRVWGCSVFSAFHHTSKSAHPSISSPGHQHASTAVSQQANSVAAEQQRSCSAAALQRIGAATTFVITISAHSCKGTMLQAGKLLNATVFVILLIAACLHAFAVAHSLSESAAEVYPGDKG